ncbi:hypothetical protein K4F52_006183 [Lecanicillium sp. MT-2017a]|nr:hypothetical protein K4F52_006183 [Lecanicillium sp. MT-2017a]
MEDDTPPFTPQQLGGMILDYYQFLATLYFDPDELRVPPKAGWPQLTNEYCANFKTPLALETLRHLPFWQSADNDLEYMQIAEHNSRFINYLAVDEFAEFDTELYPVYEGYRQGRFHHTVEPDRSDCILLAKGHETGGVNLVLDTRRGIIIEDVIGINLNHRDIEDYLGGLCDKFRSLQFIPSSKGRVTFDANGLADTAKRITEQDLVDQYIEDKENIVDWGTDLELQLVQQVYREYRWPHGFQKEPAFAVIDAAIARLQRECGRGEWPLVFWQW